MISDCVAVVVRVIMRLHDMLAEGETLVEVVSDACGEEEEERREEVDTDDETDWLALVEVDSEVDAEIDPDAETLDEGARLEVGRCVP